MTTQQADEMLEKIADMALQIEEDEDLQRADPRYSIIAKWIDVDIETVSL